MPMICFVTTFLASHLLGVGELYVAPSELFNILILIAESIVLMTV